MWDGPFSGKKTRQKGTDRQTWGFLGGYKHQKLSILRSVDSAPFRGIKLTSRRKQEALLNGSSGSIFSEVACQIKVFSSRMRTNVLAV